MDLNERAAIEGIRKTMAEYIFYTDNGRIAEFGALFGESGEFVLPDGSSYKGGVAITALLHSHAAYFGTNPAAAPPGYLRHHLTTVKISLTGDITAEAESYFMSVTQERVDHWGKWLDQFACDPSGRWLFARRVVITDGYDPAGWFANQFSKL